MSAKKMCKLFIRQLLKYFCVTDGGEPEDELGCRETERCHFVSMVPPLIFNANLTSVFGSLLIGGL